MIFKSFVEAARVGDFADKILDKFSLRNENADSSAKIEPPSSSF